MGKRRRSRLMQAKRLEAAFDRAHRETARLKQGSKCLYCKEPITAKTATLEHRNPRYRGGSNQLHNLGASCAKCNMLKATQPEKIFKKKMQNPLSGGDIQYWLAWSRWRINCSIERLEKNLGVG